MYLILLPDGGLSLEFKTVDSDAVFAVLHDMGGIDVHDGPAHVEYEVGKGRLVYTNDWDEPCLISSDVEGSKALRAMFDRLVDLSQLPRAA